MIVCGLDCSGDDILSGIVQDGRILGSRVIPARRRHTELLPQSIQTMLSEVGLTIDDVNGYAVVSGPGSFTGLRVGAAIVMGLAAPCALPVAAVGSFEFLHRLYHERGRALACVIPCRAELSYCRVYPPGDRPPTPIEVLAAPEIALRLQPPIRIIGARLDPLRRVLVGRQDGLELIEGFPPEAGGLLARWGEEKIRQGQVIDWNEWHPDYGPAPGFRTWPASRT